MDKLKYILALDQGTSSSRAILFDQKFRIINISQKESKTTHPKSGWVEQNALEIWKNQKATALDVVEKAGINAEDIACIGITNQRETTVVWDKSGKPVYPAIIWQDTRTSGICNKIRKDGLDKHIQEKTGLMVSPYFSATKLAWILDNIPNTRNRAENGELLFGTIDSWLIWNLTQGKLHITDYSNASRTMLYDINELKWDDKLLNYFNIPLQMLPEVKSCSELYGNTSVFGNIIPITGMAGDQQAALFGQQCISKGMAKNTYGTGCFLLMNTGSEKVVSKNKLLTTIAWGLNNEITYALEGSVFMGGAIVQWLRDELGLIDTASESEALAQTLADNEGVYFVPAFNGLGAPYWDTEASGTICGMRSGCGKAHIVRAGLEAMAFQTLDVITAMEKDAGCTMGELHVDGGAAANDFLMQFQSDILGSKVLRPKMLESTALGAAMLAAKAIDLYDELEDSKIIETDLEFTPKIGTAKRIELCNMWKDAVAKARK